MAKTEKWKAVVGYEGIYEVSDLGRVRGVDRKDSNNRFVKGIILKLAKQKNGYLAISLSKNDKIERKLVHRLVWESFVGTIDKHLTINHIDEDKNNNKLENLELLTQSENNHYGTRDIRAKEKMINGKNSKPCIAYNDRETICYPSLMEAERQGYYTANVSKCCKHKYGVLGNFYKGYHWKYKE